MSSPFAGGAIAPGAEMSVGVVGEPRRTVMLSVTAQYALRAFAYIADQEGDQPVLTKDIAANTGVPSQYLSRILNNAVRAGLLTSTRGVGGGFRLTRPSEKIKLIDILSNYDDLLDRSKCPFGQPRCNDDNPCGFHEHWKPISMAFREMLNETTIADVGVEGLGGHRRRRQKR